MPNPNGQRFKAMDMADANGECGSRGQAYFTECPVCDVRAALHCDKCKIQVTGCACTAKERASAEEREEIEAAELVERAKRQGLWTPGTRKWN